MPLDADRRTPALGGRQHIQHAISVPALVEKSYLLSVHDCGFVRSSAENGAKYTGRIRQWVAPLQVQVRMQPAAPAHPVLVRQTMPSSSHCSPASGGCRIAGRGVHGPSQARHWYSHSNRTAPLIPSLPSATSVHARPDAAGTCLRPLPRMHAGPQAARRAHFLLGQRVTSRHLACVHSRDPAGTCSHAAEGLSTTVGRGNEG